MEKKEVSKTRANAQAGGQKKAHCDGMIYEAIKLLEELALEKGI